MTQVILVETNKFVILSVVSDITIAKAIDVINSELVNALGNLLSRCTVIKLNPDQRYPHFYEEVVKTNLKETGVQLVEGLNALAG